MDGHFHCIARRRLAGAFNAVFSHIFVVDILLLQMKRLKTERVGLTDAMNADFPLPPSQLIIREPMFLAKVFAL